MKMFFLLLSAVASTTASKNAAEVGAASWSAFATGDMKAWRALFADDCTVEINSLPALGIASYKSQVGKDGFTMDKHLDKWTNAFEFVDYSHEEYVQSDSKMVYDCTFFLKSKTGPNRFKTKMFITIEVKDGKIFADKHDVYSAVRIDAAAEGRRNLERMISAGKTGDYSGVQAMMDNFHEDFVLIADLNYKETSGTYKGLKGFAEIGAIQAKEISFPPDFGRVGFEAHSQAADGLTSVFDFTYTYVIRADGSKFTDTNHVIWRVDDHGKLLTYEVRMFKSEPQNVAALFRNFMSKVFTNPASCRDLITDDFYVGNLGPLARSWEGIEGFDFKSLEEVDLSHYGFDAWVRVMKEQQGQMTFEGQMDMTVLSETSHERFIRFKYTQKINKTGKRYETVMDQIWKTNEAGDKLASVEAYTRSQTEVTSEKPKEL